MGPSASQVRVGEARRKRGVSRLSRRCEDVRWPWAGCDPALWRGGTCACICTRTPAHTHLRAGGRCRACNRREIGATGPSLADHAGRPLPPPFAGVCWVAGPAAGVCWVAGPAGCWTVAGEGAHVAALSCTFHWTAVQLEEFPPGGFMYVTGNPVKTQKMTEAAVFRPLQTDALSNSVVRSSLCRLLRNHSLNPCLSG